VLTGSEGGQSKPDVDIPTIIDLLRSQGVNLAGFVSHRGSLESVQELVDGMRRGEVIHAIIRPD
jgi:Zn-dependent alcohol dehydrogenase